MPSVEEILARFETGAHNTFANYQTRQSQNRMIATCWQALCQSKIALIEAGTGIGKSLAYLIAAAIFAKETGQRILIATHTIHLQEQLLSKDLPLASAILGWPIRAVLAKGMGNYICQKRVEGFCESLIGQTETSTQFEKFSAFRQTHNPSSRSDLPFPLSNSLWTKLNAESDSCLYQNCEYFNRCGLMKARDQAFSAQIVIANHHMLFADLAQRAKSANGESSVLPAYRALIVDEAHHAQEIAAHHLAATISKEETLGVMSRLMSGIDVTRSWTVGRLDGLLKLFALNEKKDPRFGQAHGYFKAIWCSLKARLVPEIEQIFSSFEAFAARLPKDIQSSGDKKVRLGTKAAELTLWDELISSPLNRLKATFQELIDSAKDALSRMTELFADQFGQNARLRFLKSEISALINRVEKINQSIALLLDYRASERIFWLEMRSERATKIACSDLNISSTIQEGLLSKLSSAIFCSATLTAHQSFDFFKKQLGFKDPESTSSQIIEQIYPSPFDYFDQTLLAVPSDLPLPNNPLFLKASCSAINAIVARVQGNTFILFTSRDAMEKSFELLKELLPNRPLLMQGDAPRYQLLGEFEEKRGAVLFGLSSFWEGVDVKAGSLRCVILAKLPFRVPDDPLLQARAESLRHQGIDPFREDALPRAIITFKQGFGRLIRRQEDFGCIVCLDHRLIKCSYGKSFLKALPKCPQIISDSDSIAKTIDAFFRKRAKKGVT